MDVTTLRKTYTGFAPAVVRAASPAARDGVPTELPPVDAATASEESQGGFLDTGDQAKRLRAAADAMRDVIERRNVFDPRSREVVFQALNAETGEVVRQTPTEVSLKLRAYVRSDEPGTPDLVGKVA
jgi:hypothetical protein